jgi:hypothetical protein
MCPLCQSSQVVTKDVGKKTGAAVGGLAGAVSGWVSTLSGAELGAGIGIVAGPAGWDCRGYFGSLFRWRNRQCRGCQTRRSSG